MAFRFADRWQGRIGSLFPDSPNREELLALLELRDRDLETRLEPSAWADAVLLNSWVNFGGTEQVAQYRLVASDRVDLRGVIKSGTVGFVPAFTLPVGLRPPANQPIATLSNGAHAELYVTADGEVQIITGSNVSVSLHCSFSVAP